MLCQVRTEVSSDCFLISQKQKIPWGEKKHEICSVAIFFMTTGFSTALKPILTDDAFTTIRSRLSLLNLITNCNTCIANPLCAKRTLFNNSGLFRAIVIERSYCWRCMN